MAFSRQEYWGGLLFPSPGGLPYPEIKPGSPAVQADSLPTELQGKPKKWNNETEKKRANSTVDNKIREDP